MATLEALKDHVRVLETDFDNELQLLLDAAIDHLKSIDVVMADPLPPALFHAVLLLAGYWFNNGGSVLPDGAVQRPIPYGVTRLIAPYREVSL